MSSEHYPRFETGTPAAQYQQIVNFSINYLEGMLVELAHMELQPPLTEESELYAHLQHKLIRRERTVRHGFQIQLEKLFTAYKTFRRSRLNANRASDWHSLGLAGHSSSRLLATIESIASKHADRYPRQIFNLDRRLKSLVHRSDESADENPLSPANLCHAFLYSIDALNLPAQQTRRMFDLFDLMLEQQLDSFYKQLDLGLYHLDVMPELTDNSLFIQPEDTATVIAVYNDTPPPGDDEHVDDGGDDIDVAAVADEPGIPVTEAEEEKPVAAQSEETAPEEEQGGATDSAFMNPEDTLDELKAQQNIKALLRAFRESTRDGFDDHVDRFLELHRQINPLLEGQQITQIRKFTHYYASLLTSPMLADDVANQLSRLAGVVVEMLLEDNRFFTDDAHPVQNFINSVVDFEIRCKHKGDSYTSLCAFIDSLIEIEHPSIASFHPVIREYEAMKTGEIQFILAQKKDQKKLEKQLKSTVLELINEITANLTVSQETMAFFYDDWQLLLLQLGRKIGRNSEEFRQAAEIARMLAWSFSNDNNPDSKEFRNISFRSLLVAVEKGLESLGFSSAHRDGVRKQLIRDFRDHQPKKPVDPLSYIGQPAAERIDFFSSTIRSHAAILSDIQTPVRVDNRSDDDTMLACQLDIGAWVEIRTGAGKTFKRAKLKWKSKSPDQYIFVDQRGHKIRQLSEEELDRELADEKIKPLNLGGKASKRKSTARSVLGSGFHCYE